MPYLCYLEDIDYNVIWSLKQRLSNEFNFRTHRANITFTWMWNRTSSIFLKIGYRTKEQYGLYNIEETIKFNLHLKHFSEHKTTLWDCYTYSNQAP
jgi:hypothetical protein